MNMRTATIEGYQLSTQQKQIWLRSRENGNVPRLQAVAKLEGPLDCERLKTVVESVVTRHEVLRTTFRLLPGMTVPVQTVAASLPPDWNKHDLRSLAAVEAAARRAAVLAEEWTREFDLERGPLLRVTLIAESEHLHSLLLTIPALCADAESLKVLLKEIAYWYSLDQEVETGFADEPVQYAQYSAWQEDLLALDDARAGRSHWQELAAKVALELSLPFQVESPCESGMATTPAFAAGRELSNKIEMLALQQKVSPDVLLLSAWLTLVWRLTGKAGFVTVLARDGRDSEELQGVLGPLAKYVPYVFEPSKEMPFIEFLEQVRQEIQAVSNLEEFYSPEIFSTVAGGRLGQLIWPIGFEFTSPLGSILARGVRFELEKLRSDLERFKLRLGCRVQDDEFLVTLDYDAGLFRSEDMDRMGQRFRTLLEDICRAPGTPLGRLSLVCESERRMLVDDLNRTTADYPTERCIHELFESRVSLTPDNIAVRHDNSVLSYGELNGRASQLAKYITALGAGPDKTVGIVLERSTDAILGILGTLKAGAAYVPFDPTYPSERLASMMEDARVSVLLTHERFLSLLKVQTTPVVCLDRDWPTIAGDHKAITPININPLNAAYVIYTSGSTGQPKGVVVTHRNLVHSTTARFSYYGEPVGNFLLTSPFVFDSSVAGIFWTLCQGGTLTLPGTNFQQDPSALFQLIAESGVTHLLCVPSLYNVILEQSPLHLLESLRTVIVAGEACPRRVIERHFELLPDVTLYNEYGPTEGSVWSSVYRFRGEESGRHVPIGQPISNTSIYLLDEWLQPVPLGVPGELYLGGAGLSRGYLNRPDRTAEKFLPHPFSDDPGERVYRTGDLARYRADSNLEFLGRIDNQVKISGHRIELGEIETVLEQHPLVQRAVVVASEQTHQARLVAYVVPDFDAKVSETGIAHKVSRNELLPDELRAFLNEKLPAYMAPSNFVMLDELPLTPNGKLNRKALPAPEEPATRKKNFVAPRSEAEHFLADIWREVLGLEEVGVYDSFFEMGGDSIKGIVLINKVQERLSERVQLANLLEAPRIADLAVHLSTHYPQALSKYYEAGKDNVTPARLTWSKDSEARQSLHHDRGNEEEEPLSLSQRRLWFLFQLERGATYNLPGAARLEGQLDETALRQSFNEVIRRHEILRVAFPSREGMPAQVKLPYSDVALPLLDLSHLSADARDSEARRLVAEEARKPFDLGTGPLFRARLIRLGARDHLLLVTMHHIISDGWSIEIFIRELAACYQSFTLGQPVQLPPLPAQYSDFARWQRLRLQEVLEEQLAYWRSQLSGIPTALGLPTDYPRPAFQTANGATFSFNLQQVSDKLRAIGAAQDASLFMTLLAAFKVLLHYHTGQPEIIVGTDVANRSRAEFEGLIGFFVNQLVLRTVLHGHLTFQELVSRVREVALGAYAHQDVPFDRLVEALNIERDPSRNPLFQVLFALHKELPTDTMKQSGLRLSVVDTGIATSAFDLSLHVTETADGLKGTFRYNTDLFKETTIARLSRHLALLLQYITTSPAVSVETLQKLLAAADSEEERAMDQSRQQVRREQYKAAKRKTVYS